jgi:hypothetical protein
LPLFFLIVSVCGQLVQLFPNTGNAGNATVPAARLLHSFDYDQNGAFLLFGGLGIGTSGWGYLSSLWRYDQESMSWSLIDGNGESDTQARSDSKPTPRGLHASWVDGASGNLWIFGGYGLNETGSEFGMCLSIRSRVFDFLVNTYIDQLGLLSDVWVYNVSSADGVRWRQVTGSRIINNYVSGQPSPMNGTGHWRDQGDNCFYIFGGFGSTGGTEGYCRFTNFTAVL